MGHGMGQGVTHTFQPAVLMAKSKKNHRFLIENGGFLVGGLKPNKPPVLPGAMKNFSI